MGEPRAALGHHGGSSHLLGPIKRCIRPQLATIRNSSSPALPQYLTPHPTPPSSPSARAQGYVHRHQVLGGIGGCPVPWPVSGRAFAACPRSHVLGGGGLPMEHMYDPRYAGRRPRRDSGADGEVRVDGFPSRVLWGPLWRLSMVSHSARARSRGRCAGAPTLNSTRGYPRSTASSPAPTPAPISIGAPGRKRSGSGANAGWWAVSWTALPVRCSTAPSPRCAPTRARTQLDAQGSAAAVPPPCLALTRLHTRAHLALPFP